MMIKNQSARNTEESFRKVLRMRMVYMSSIILFGLAVMLIFAVLNGSVTNINGSRQQAYSLEYFSGLGGGIVIAGSIRLIKIIRTIKDPGKFQKAYTEYIDERNRFVLMKAYQTSAYIFIILLALATLVTNFLSPAVTSTLAVCLGTFSLILTITYRIINRLH